MRTAGIEALATTAHIEFARNRASVGSCDKRGHRLDMPLSYNGS